ncbi:MAG TPA: polysaccharide biosynthesis protein [Bacteroidetes bacterium]|nr:polysaccharide biosynthesis protein [Bacteroidota bacterium]
MVGFLGLLPAMQRGIALWQGDAPKLVIYKNNMSLLKKLAGETAIYGLSSIVGRVLNYLLVPLYTNIFLREEYGIVTQLYAWVAFLMVIYIYRMDTAFFRFGTQRKERERVFSTTFWAVAGSALVFSALIFYYSEAIARWYVLPDSGAGYIRIFALVLAYDTLSEIPLARLRLEGRAMRFATIRLTGIALNIGLNLFFLLVCPWLLEHGYGVGFLRAIYNPFGGIGYIFISNLIASAAVLLMLLPEIRLVRWHFDTRQWKTMATWSAPLVLAGLAGIVNEMIDREMLVRLLPFDIETNRGQQGVYSACYKLAMLMSLFTQAFRYAAEPFFFANAKNKDAKILYADVAKYFTIAGVLAFLFINFYIDIFKYFIGKDYWEGLGVVPVLLMANLFLGLYYNVSIWFKLTDQTMKGGVIAIGGAIVTIALNYWWIPLIGYTGSAWATLLCYLFMTVVSWRWGRKYYPVAYDVRRIAFYVLLGLGLFATSVLLGKMPFFGQQMLYTANSLLFIVFLFVTWRLEKQSLKNIL